MSKKKKASQKLAIEDYLDFIDNRTLDLTAGQLRQIIGMHGFKMLKFQKNVSIEMISTMDLMDLPRSTLLDDAVSGDACFTLEEVMKDLKDLDWQECHVTSLLTLGTVVSASASASSGGDGAAVSVKRKRPKGLKKNPVEVGDDNSVISDGTTVAARGTTGRLRSVKYKSLAAVSCSTCSSPVSSNGRQIRRGSMKSKKS